MVAALSPPTLKCPLEPSGCSVNWPFQAKLARGVASKR
jgi:hypothetical protein